MSLLSKLADRLVLQPSTDPIDTDDRERHAFDVSGREVEAWVVLSPCNVRYRSGASGWSDVAESAVAKRVVAIKFPGAGGRAERGGPHPFEVWNDVEAEIWTINHAGYGGSTGPATLGNFAATCDAVYQSITSKSSDAKIVVVGNSLGCVSALYVASRFDVDGLFLRNPVPLQQMISRRPRYNRWSFGMAKYLARSIPGALDAVANPAKCSAPAFFVQSEMDRVVPPEYQDLIFDAFAGPKKKFVLNGVDHHESVPEDQANEYVESLGWLRDKVVGTLRVP